MSIGFSIMHTNSLMYRMTSRHVRTSLTWLTVVCYSSYSTGQTCLESIHMLKGLAAESLFGVVLWTLIRPQ